MFFSQRTISLAFPDSKNVAAVRRRSDFLFVNFFLNVRTWVVWVVWVFHTISKDEDAGPNRYMTKLFSRSKLFYWFYDKQ